MKRLSLKGKRLIEIRAIEKRQNELYDELFGLECYKVDKPIRYGWHFEIVIIPQVNLYKNNSAIKELLAKVQRKYWGKTKEEAKVSWSKQISQYDITRNIPTISRKTYNRLSASAKVLCVPFYYRTERKKLRLRFYLRIPHGAYVLRFKRAYITHFQRINPLLQQELDNLENTINRNMYFNLMQKNRSWKCYYGISKYKQNKLKVKAKLKTYLGNPQLLNELL